MCIRDSQGVDRAQRDRLHVSDSLPGHHKRWLEGAGLWYQELPALPSEQEKTHLENALAPKQLLHGFAPVVPETLDHGLRVRGASVLENFDRRDPFNFAMAERIGCLGDVF